MLIYIFTFRILVAVLCISFSSLKQPLLSRGHALRLQRALGGGGPHSAQRVAHSTQRAERSELVAVLIIIIVTITITITVAITMGNFEILKFHF
jgi:hypothetical protein